MFIHVTPGQEIMMHVLRDCGHMIMDDMYGFNQSNPSYSGRDNLYQDQSRGGYYWGRAEAELRTALMLAETSKPELTLPESTPVIDFMRITQPDEPLVKTGDNSLWLDNTPPYDACKNSVFCNPQTTPIEETVDPFIYSAVPIADYLTADLIPDSEGLDLMQDCLDIMHKFAKPEDFYKPPVGIPTPTILIPDVTFGLDIEKLDSRLKFEYHKVMDAVREQGLKQPPVTDTSAISMLPKGIFFGKRQSALYTPDTKIISGKIKYDVLAEQMRLNAHRIRSRLIKDKKPTVFSNPFNEYQPRHKTRTTYEPPVPTTNLFSEKKSRVPNVNLVEPLNQKHRPTGIKFPEPLIQDTNLDDKVGSGLFEVKPKDWTTDSIDTKTTIATPFVPRMPSLDSPNVEEPSIGLVNSNHTFPGFRETTDPISPEEIARIRTALSPAQDHQRYSRDTPNVRKIRTISDLKASNKKVKRSTEQTKNTHLRKPRTSGFRDLDGKPIDFSKYQKQDPEPESYSEKINRQLKEALAGDPKYLRGLELDDEPSPKPKTAPPRDSYQEMGKNLHEGLKKAIPFFKSLLDPKKK
ncbi:hypothetical protein HOK51_06750 [Candidatus Woesearchaeota archaeon]|jgi:hypothetical protein|nr:hypothetical protein [Candidatus Woesearchaeota archaeon]MBT6519521.1 hypothetical protein [Candidatus Woesearchaeota archaeon]MBT7367734.1 hypothetical protein [Candidatus Woesearchaeota archaeon]